MNTHPRVLYELSHTACDREIIHNCQGFVFDGIGVADWNGYERPRPDHLRDIVPGYRNGYDLAVVATEELLWQLPPTLPKVWKCLWDFGEARVPDKVLHGISAWVAPCRETAVHWHMHGNPKAHVVEHGIDSLVFSGWCGDVARVLSVGNRVARRPDKFPTVLGAVAGQVKLDLVGDDNDDFPLAERIGYAGMAEMADQYRKHRVYFNPSVVIGCATLEAMATGCPLVTMKPDNFIDLLQHGRNCLLAATPDDAVAAIKRLLGDLSLCQSLGAAARESVRQRFSPARCGAEWGAILRQVCII